MKIIAGKEQEYKAWYDKNSDEYSRACFTYAERWAEMLERKTGETGDAKEAIERYAEFFSHEADVEGITGFMYGCAVNILSLCWEYGEELRQWHNKKYGHNGDGVVNPAILIVKK